MDDIDALLFFEAAIRFSLFARISEVCRRAVLRGSSPGVLETFL